MLPAKHWRRKMTDLIERLREVGGINDDGATRWYINPDGPEAADRIEKDAAHIDEMYALVAAMNADHTASKTRIEKLETALRAIAFARPECCAITNAMQSIARKALEGKDD